ncbi:MAG: type II toxin-antitoxin system HicA family toxin [Pseudomonadota bacterium]
MSHKHHAQLLRSIFQDPLPANLHWREIESLLAHLGAELSPAHGARFKVVLNGQEGFLHHPHHSTTLDRQGVKLLREFLTRAGVSPSGFEAEGR